MNQQRCSRYSDSLRADGSGIDSRWGENLRTRLDRPWVLPSLLYNGYRVIPRDKLAGAWCWPLTPIRAEVEERVELHLYSPFGLSWPVLRHTFTLLSLT
jgi:hypothetical protein